MARTSRRNAQVVSESSAVLPVSLMPAQRLQTAAYARLSAEREDDTTIEMQVSMLKEFILKRDDLELTEVYVDNGYTGTDFERPAFHRLMTDIQSGKIRCVVVKDLSRFGRNFLETGYYIETLFPKLNVKLISINDAFDSSKQSDQDAISIPIKNMVNQMYAMDASRKCSIAHELKRKNKEYTLLTSMYGYTLDKEKNQLIVDPQTAPIVQLIFRWYLQGHGMGMVAGLLNQMGILTPRDYKEQCEGKLDPNRRRLWNASTVDQIVRRGDYTGDRCIGKYIKAKYMNVPFQRNDFSKWVVCEDAHEPLITREEFDQVKNMIEESIQKKKKAKQRLTDMNPDFENLFEDLVYCGKCGRKMYLKTRKNKRGEIKLENVRYACSRDKHVIGSGCRVQISLDYLKIVVRDQIQMITRAALDQDQALRKLQKREDDRNPAIRCRKQVESLCMKEESVNIKIDRLYEDLSDGIIDKEDYNALKLKYQKEREALIQQIAEARENLNTLQEYMREHHELADRLKAQMNDISITRALLDAMIEKIIIGPDNEIEIQFKFSDVFRAAAEMIGGDGK